MHISQLTLSHFRSHKYTQVQVESGPVALFGGNGAGKTNLIEAISLLSPGKGIRKANTADLSKSPDNIGWKLNAEVVSGVSSNLIETSWETTSSRIVKINDKVVKQNDLAKVFRVVWLLPSMDRLWLEGADGRRKFLDRLTLSFFPKHADCVLNYEKAMRERNRLLKEKMTDDVWYKALERQMAQNGLLIQSNRIAALKKISSAQENSTTTFPVAELSLSKKNGDLTTDEDEYVKALSENRQLDIMAGRTLIGPHRSDMEATYKEKGISAKDSSTGEQKAMLISIVLANARALKLELGYPPVILLDEISAHLDIDRRGALYEEINALGAQAWMTGTDKNLFSELGYFDEDLPACEDYDFWLRYSVQHEFHYVEKPLLIKNGGHSDQLSKKYWGMDRFRVLSMEKLLKNNLLTEYQRNAIHNELIFKLDILINGARKRDNTSFFTEMSKKKYLYQCLQKN